MAVRWAAAVAAAGLLAVTGCTVTVPDPGYTTPPPLPALEQLKQAPLSEARAFSAGGDALAFVTADRNVVCSLTSARGPHLNLPYALTFTVILVLSSVTCQMGVFAAERFQPVTRADRWWKIWTREYGLWTWGMREWYVLTYAAGALFIAGQIFEYAKLVSEGLTISANAYGSVFYLTTGFHGAHVTGGLIAFLLIIGRSFAAKRFGHAEATSAIVTSYYWHFVDVVWIGLFFVIYILQ